MAGLSDIWGEAVDQINGRGSDKNALRSHAPGSGPCGHNRYACKRCVFPIFFDASRSACLIELNALVMSVLVLAG
jgi:hypothetical protein